MVPLGVAAGVLSARFSPFFPATTPSEPSLVKASSFKSDLHYLEDKSASSQSRVVRSIGCCPCGRRHLLGASAAAVMCSIPSWKAATSFAFELDDPTPKFRSARPDWCDELFAKSMEEGMKSYESEIAGYKADLFSFFTTSKKVLELGVGTGPNFKYYAHNVDLHIVGIDPNKQMEKYARNAAVAAGLPQMNFTFVQGSGEYLPVEDGSFDAVIGTLVLCTVKDVSRTLQEVRRVLKIGGLYFFIEHVAAPGGTLLRFAQMILDPLQQLVADGCHLARETGEQISSAGFSSLELNKAYVPTLPILGPHVYGMACR